MGYISQRQRRAIESLRFYATPLPNLAHPFFLGHRHVYILGISTGIGTCSDVRDVDVLVLGLGPVMRPHIPFGCSIERCAYAVLERDATAGEKEEYSYFVHGCVELLKPENINGKSLFSLTGVKQCYPRL